MQGRSPSSWPAGHKYDNHDMIRSHRYQIVTPAGIPTECGFRAPSHGAQCRQVLGFGNRCLPLDVPEAFNDVREETRYLELKKRGTSVLQSASLPALGCLNLALNLALDSISLARKS